MVFTLVPLERGMFALSFHYRQESHSQLSRVCSSGKISHFHCKMPCPSLHRADSYLLQRWDVNAKVSQVFSQERVLHHIIFSVWIHIWKKDPKKQTKTNVSKKYTEQKMKPFSNTLVRPRCLLQTAVHNSHHHFAVTLASKTTMWLPQLEVSSKLSSVLTDTKIHTQKVQKNAIY